MTEISVVIPTKDRLRFLQRAIPMFLDHEEVKEVIVVVDGCSDGTLKYVKHASSLDDRIRFVDNVINKGLPYSRNAGIDVARCDLVFTAEDDLEIEPGFFATLVAHMKQSNADIISGRNIFRFERETTDEAVQRSDAFKGEPVNKTTLVANWGIAVASDEPQLMLPAPMLGSTAIFRKIRYDEGYRVNFWREESDFQLSAQEQGYRLVLCRHAVSMNIMIENDGGGVRGISPSKRMKWVIRNNWRFLGKHEEFIRENFQIGNPYIYIARFTVRLVFVEAMLPILMSMKQRLLPGLTLHRNSS